MQRIQIKRIKGWRKPTNAVYVGHPSDWGNPYDLKGHDRDTALKLYSRWLDEKLEKDPTFLDPLRGNDLMCYCPLDEDCHADILLKKIEATNVGVVVTENKTPKNCEPVREGEMPFVVLNNGNMKMVSGMVKSGDIKCPTCGDKSGTLVWSCCHTPIENSVPIAEKQFDEWTKALDSKK